MATCKDCLHYEVCKRIDYELEYHNKSIKEAEEELPIKCRFFKNKTDVVPVVRCKDCMHCEHIPIDFCKVWHLCKIRDNLSQKEAYDYCSYGERKI